MFQEDEENDACFFSVFVRQCGCSATTVKFYSQRKMSSSAVAVIVFGDILLIFVAVVLAAMAIRAAFRRIVLSNGHVVPAHIVVESTAVESCPRVPALPDGAL